MPIEQSQNRRSGSSSRGSILMETVISMPILLFIILGIVQFSQVWLARQMTAYAAYCGARAVLVVKPGEAKTAAKNAAEVALSWVTLAGIGDGATEIPGWGGVTGSSSVKQRVEVSLPADGEGSDETVVCTVRFRFPLMIPSFGINRILASAPNHGVGGFDREGDFHAGLDEAAEDTSEIDGYPYVELVETCALPKPYSTSAFPTGGLE